MRNSELLKADLAKESKEQFNEYTILLNDELDSLNMSIHESVKEGKDKEEDDDLEKRGKDSKNISKSSSSALSFLLGGVALLGTAVGVVFYFNKKLK